MGCVEAASSDCSHCREGDVMSAAEFKPLRDVLPPMRPNVDFGIVEVRGDMYIAFVKCPFCGRRIDFEKGNLAVMEFDHPAFDSPLGYLVHKRCGQELEGTYSRASAQSSNVASAVRGAWLALRELAGMEVPQALVVVDPATLAPGSGVAS